MNNEEREFLHELLAEADAVIDPNEHPELSAKLTFVLSDCVGGCVPMSRSRLKRMSMQLGDGRYASETRVREAWMNAAREPANSGRQTELEAARTALAEAREFVAMLRPEHYPGECDHCGIDDLPPETCPHLAQAQRIKAWLAAQTPSNS